MEKQRYKICLLNGEMLQVEEKTQIPHDRLLQNRFKNANKDAVLMIGDSDCEQFYIPIRNILYISTENQT